MDYDDAIRWLRTLPDFERTGEFSARTDVEPVRALLRGLGDPHRGRATLHIAGSKGKGSTAVMAEQILRAAGRRVGTYISPHLHRYAERIRIDGAPSTPDVFASALTAVRGAMPAAEAAHPGRQLIAFDALTAAAFVAFRDAAMDTQVVEVGLGGLLDSTNVFAEPDAPHVCVITPISLEHADVLGATIPEIAAQKAGIITSGATVVVAPQRESALDVIRETAAGQGARVVEVAASCRLSAGRLGDAGREFKLQTPRATYGATVPLAGRHQLENAAAAVLACEEIAAQCGFELSSEAVRKGLAAVVWPARMEVLRRSPLVIIDGAHNGDSAKRMVAALRDDFSISHATFILGTLAGKDIQAMADAIAGTADEVVAPSWESARAADPRAVAGVLAQHGISTSTAGTAGDAYETALERTGGRGPVVAFGSLAFAATLRSYLLGIESDMIKLQFKQGRAL